ncbi:MAG: isochorismatase [Gammaproteobacteria bacterium]|nr:isochorismatase [Gammaproteobacteria bacterium]
MPGRELPIPPHFSPDTIGDIWRVPYETRAREARQWAAEHEIQPAAEDRARIGLLLVDVQNTFCLPEFELYVAGRSGTGAIDDNRRVAEFIYRNLGHITRILPTMDTHQAMQIFHAIWLVDDEGRHPDPFTLVSVEDVQMGRWRFNPEVGRSLGIDADYGQRHLLHYASSLAGTGKYDLTVWPYHSMLGGIGHALVPAIEEAVFFHTIARFSQADFRVKGRNSLTEHYSVLGPEVTTDAQGRDISAKDTEYIDCLWGYDAIVVAGQAKSHCVAWTVDDMLRSAEERDPSLARKVYLLEDCTSPVVVPGMIDYTDDADAAFRRFADAGMHLVRSTMPMRDWPGMPV